MAESKVLVSVIIVAYEAFEETKACLISLPIQSSFEYEVIVVDNGKSELLKAHMVEHHPLFLYLRPAENLGYAAGNNYGVKHARGKYFFFLNPDTELHPFAIEELLNFIQGRSKVGIVAPILSDSNGAQYAQQGSRMLTPLTLLAAHSFFHRIWPSNPISNWFWYKNQSLEKDRRVEVVPGTALLIRADLFIMISGFDEIFFLYFEEYDLCRRVLQQNAEIWQISKAKVTHHWHSSTRVIEASLIFMESRRKYLNKHYPFWASIIEEILKFSPKRLIELKSNIEF